jgi:RNA polymerase sigma factor (sigma-70 family)
MADEKRDTMENNVECREHQGESAKCADPCAVYKSAKVSDSDIPLFTPLVCAASKDCKDAQAVIAKRFFKGSCRAFIARKVPQDDVEDVLQNVCEQVLRRWSTLRKPESFKFWVAKIMSAQIAEYYRSRNRLLLIEDIVTQAPQNVEKEVIGQLIRDYIIEEINKLPEKYRQILVLEIEYPDISRRELANRLNITCDAAKQRISRARKELLVLLIRAGIVETSDGGDVNE